MNFWGSLAITNLFFNLFLFFTLHIPVTVQLKIRKEFTWSVTTKAFWGSAVSVVVRVLPAPTCQHSNPWIQGPCNLT